MKLFRILSFIIIASLMLQSCHTTKPIGNISSPDYNKRVVVSDALMKKSKSISAYIVVIVSFAIVGGIMVSQTEWTEDGKEVSTSTKITTGALLGAAAGWILSMWMDEHIMDNNSPKMRLRKSVPVTDPSEWLRKSNMEQYKPLSGSGSKFTIIHTSAESDYTVKDIQDVRDFLTAFPHSFYTEKVLLTAVDNLSKNDWSELITLLPADSKIQQSITAKMADIREKERISQTFTFFAKNYVETKINIWQQKGEFERTADWQERVNENTRAVKAKELLVDAEREYIAERSRKFDAGNMTLGAYDPDNQTYLVKNSIYGDWLVHVPINEAPNFRDSWSRLGKVPQFAVINDELAIIGMNFTASDRTYKYSNQASLNYTIANIDYNFAPIDINTGTPQSAPQGQQNISTVDLSVGNQSDVARNIPVTNVVNDKTFAVIIANENYQSESRVEFAKNDGETFKKYCIQTLGLPERNVHFKADATLNNIRSAILWLDDVAKAFKGEANIIFYYAGHGIPDESSRSSYLLPVDGFGSDVRTGYKLDRLYQTLGQMPAKSITVFMDACFSGAQRSGEMLASARGVAIKTTQETPKGNMVVFSAAQGDETAFSYREKGHGMFTYFLLKKLQESKGDATLGELGAYIETNVRQQSVVVNKKSQTPTVTPATAMGDKWREMKLK